MYKASLSDFTAFTDRLNNQEGNVCFALSWLSSVPAFIKLLQALLS
jgi:hypothetical protein